MSRSNAAIDVARLQQSSYWREEDGRAVIEAWRRSGLPLAWISTDESFPNVSMPRIRRQAQS